MTRPWIAALAAFGVSTAVLAADGVAPTLDDPVSLRMNMMQQVGGAMKLATALHKGEAAYDARVAEAAFRTMHAVALGYAAQFPPGSETGHGTKALPAVWESPAEFRSKLAQFIADTGAAVAAKPADTETFKPVFEQVAANCRGCHTPFRSKD